MSKNTKDIEDMLEYLKLDVMARNLNLIVRSKELISYNPIQFMREIVTKEYDFQHNENITSNIRKAKLKGSNAQIENLISGNGRLYNENTVKQLKTLEFIKDRMNIAIFGKSGAGKTYFSKALGIESCRNGYRTLFIDFTELIDNLCIFKREDLKKYKKKLTYYSRIQVLIIDDFLINHLDEERTIILFSLVKKRDEIGTSTVITSQYSAEDWNIFMQDKNNYAMADSIRRRLLNKGYIVYIEKVETKIE